MKKEFTYLESIDYTGDSEQAFPHEGLERVDVTSTHEGVVLHAVTWGRSSEVLLPHVVFDKAVAIVARARIARLVATGDPAPKTETTN